MTRDRTHLCAAVLAAVLMTNCAPPPAASEPQSQVLSIDQVAGFWSLRGPDGARCQVSLANLLIDGVRPVLAENCAIPDATKAKSWRATADGFVMLAQDGSTVMAFRRMGEDAFASTSGGYRLDRAAMR